MKQYKNPIPTVDTIIENYFSLNHNFQAVSLVFIKRKNPPYGYALPGGFVDEGEHLAFAAKRETAEETGLKVDLYEQFFTFSNPKRDPRKHTVSTVFLGRSYTKPIAGDDASDVFISPLGKLKKGDNFENLSDLLELNSEDLELLRNAEFKILPSPQVIIKDKLLAFDHNQILSLYIKFKTIGQRPNVDI